MTAATTQGQRRPRNTIRTARMYATRLQAAELALSMAPIRASLAAAVAGVAVQRQHQILDTQAELATEIERTRIVRGLAGHIAQAQAALQSWASRAMASGTWRPVPLEFAEQDALATFVDLHEFQLQQLSAGEIYRATLRMISRVESAGGQVLRVDQDMATPQQ
ncbi:hypothetical protein [Comamonas terrigena]|uniref:hypothetical protein n=1 Tax=Comamonas terrigena TaxID=32013 RepID=UPI00244C8FF3|nr:hypothetical protein [Comamonas terrigena]MDH0049658.1 hypothetical protein [Comamonas terrigena]MDH0511310.1 hypothetical protein [Comamonas terrigena]MDH1091387.1 hypothetical protein [Comamonas terrigena]